MTAYLSIAKRVVAEYVEKRSRFIAVLAPVETVEEGLRIVSEVKKEYRDARHYPYAIISAPTENSQKASDDGEPQGTAGIPLLDALKKRGLSAVVLVVVRYFGGIKLGASGLTLAFKTAAAMAVEQAVAVEAVLSDIVAVDLTYNESAIMEKISGDYCEVIDKEYADGVRLTVATTDYNRFAADVKKCTFGRENPHKIKQEYHFYKGE